MGVKYKMKSCYDALAKGMIESNEKEEAKWLKVEVDPIRHLKNAQEHLREAILAYMKLSGRDNNFYRNLCFTQNEIILALKDLEEKCKLKSLS